MCHRRRQWLTAACAILVAGCGASASNSSGAGKGPPLGSEEFGLSMEQLVSRVDAVEASIGRCMKAAGFEYVPVDFATIKAAMDSDGSARRVSGADYIAQFGYGVTTRLGEQDPVVANGKGGQNVAIYTALSPGDKTAYNRALYGENVNATFARALESEDLSATGGCTGTAIAQSFRPDELKSTYVNPADKRIESDKRMITALARWSTCVRTAGYEYDRPDDIPDDITHRLDAIFNRQDPKALTGSALDALTQLQGYERAVAVAAHKCETDIVEPVVAQIESEIFGAPKP